MNNIEHIKRMAHSPLRDYVIPGLTSYLVGNIPGSTFGCVRLFECSREHHEAITPHSHRFDFQCLVLDGCVKNLTWTPAETDEQGDLFCVTELQYHGAPGQYASSFIKNQRFKAEEKVYSEGQWCGMGHDEIHSIYFGRGTSVLFFEGSQVSDRTMIIEPCVDGRLIPTFEVKPWMFRAEK